MPSPAQLTIDGVTVGGGSIQFNAYPAGNTAPQPPGSVIVGPVHYIDPLNVTGNANDANFPGSPQFPMQTWLGLMQRWGTSSPSFLQPNNYIIFLSGTNTGPTYFDPVIFTPYLLGGANVSLVGTPQPIPNQPPGGGTLANTVAKNRAVGANALLQTNLSALGAPAQFVTNVTRASRAWSYAALGANVFSMTQPFVVPTTPGPGGFPLFPPLNFIAPAEVDTWANGDRVQLSTMPRVDIGLLQPTCLDGTGVLNVMNMTVPGKGATPSVASINTNSGPVAFYECSFETTLQVIGPGFPCTLFNCVTGVLPNVSGCYNGNTVLIGGANISGLVDIFSPSVILIDGDYILGGQIDALVNTVGTLGIGFMYLDKNLVVNGGSIQLENEFYAGNTIYGSGANTIKLNAQTHLGLPAGTFVGSFTAPGLVTGIQLNGANTASSHTGASPDVLNSGITTTPAHLDAAAGVAGFGGNAFILGGASCSKFI